MGLPHGAMGWSAVYVVNCFSIFSGLICRIKSVDTLIPNDLKDFCFFLYKSTVPAVLRTVLEPD